MSRPRILTCKDDTAPRHSLDADDAFGLVDEGKNLGTGILNTQQTLSINEIIAQSCANYLLKLGHFVVRS